MAALLLQNPGRPGGPAISDADADAYVDYAADRQDVWEVAADLWRTEHAFGVDAFSEVEAAAAAASQATLRLDTAVALARHSGASWADIGRAPA